MQRITKIAAIFQGIVKNEIMKKDYKLSAIY